ncbi:hypothetical protein [Paracoccus denitrificans]|jgi:hypothetical protein|uniref:Lipoprotein n=1 Tax=Paracoccus denitrificans (strain Pd 1222) TaxID=318586 RepID=A1B016_PARDP|nr:hypothetical protein [Paracoccus denitrificans]ABL68860.1 hypothetical protein Pden_0748 [Paracoccus denitrificans PD1222]MBB4625415.1 hypothetical protein [Paracoccus denitrificans]MCU7428241.1 hypothetical protein [Paracoccus denitrificans]QAR26906.1 hypothetical protein EO213_11685 [Paracoccus denitrificans]UPV95863.1 hypothetical protein M0K93_04545 [Paracoccus denitrificans]
MNVAIRHSGVLLSLTALAGCGVEIARIEDGNPRRERGYEFVASTFNASNNDAVPANRMLRAAVKHCRLPYDNARETIPHSGAYGVHGTWMMDFACSAPEKDTK